MKQVLFIIFSSFTVVAYSQQDTIMASNKVYLMKVTKISGDIEDGFVKNMNDSLLYYSMEKIKLGTAISLSDPKISYSEIQSIRIKRKGAAGRGALIGGGIGFGLGLILGLADGDDPEDTWFAMSAGEKGLAAGVLLGAGGALIGAVLGVLSGKNFHIQSHKSNFLELQSFLAKKTKQLSANY